VSLTSESSSVSEAYEDVGDTALKFSACEFQVKSGDISGLCLRLGNLCLDSPRTEEGTLPFDSKDPVYNAYSSPDISVPICNADISGSGKFTQDTNQLQCLAPTLYGDSTFVLESSEEYGLGVLQNTKITNEDDEIKSPQKNAVSLEATKTFDSEVSLLEDNLQTSAENSASKTDTTKTVRTDRHVEVKVSNHTDIHQAVSESNEIQDKVSFVVEYSKDAVSEEYQGLFAFNDAQEYHAVDVNKNFKKTDVTEEICHTQAEDINLAPSIVEEPLLHTDITDAVEGTENCLKSKSLHDLESAWTSASHEGWSVDKEVVSEFTGPAVDNSSEADSGITLPVEIEIAKVTPTVLSELFEICNRQQKDLELDNEQFIDGAEFFSSPSRPGNLREKVELHVPHSSVSSRLEESVLDHPVASEFKEFNQTIADEVENILQEIMNSSSECRETDLTESDSRHSNSTLQANLLNTTAVMADMQRVSNSTTSAMDENSANPFVSESSLNRSPSPCGKSPRSSSTVASPCESPYTKSKLSSINAVKDISHNHESGGASPSTHSGKNSPDPRTYKVNKKFYSDITQF
jgi:cell fate (sporulation/competence/biofilm development) regulator YmcA (YheA/YmcA/DUF963 family)